MNSLKRSQVIYRSTALDCDEQEEDPIEEGDASDIPPQKRRFTIKYPPKSVENESPDEEIESSNDFDSDNNVHIPDAQIVNDKSDEVESEIDESVSDSKPMNDESLNEEIESQGHEEIESQGHDFTDELVAEISSSQVHHEPTFDVSDEIEQCQTQTFMSSDCGEEIDMTGHEEFFREEFIMMRFIEEESDQLDLFDCGQTRVLVCEHIPVEGESENAVFEKLMCDAKYRVIVDAKKVPKRIDEGTKFVMKMPLFTFAHGQQFGVIAPNFFQAE
jgi:hypothetical protein